MTYETNQIIKHQLWLEYNDNYLAHYGTKGQKWGIRKYQNPDGSLTEEGKIRYNANDGGNKKFDRKFNKDIKRLQKLDDKANVKLQQQRAEKYAARAKTTGKATLQIGLAGLATVFGGIKYNQLADDMRRTNYEIASFLYPNHAGRPASTPEGAALYLSEKAGNRGYNKWSKSTDFTAAAALTSAAGMLGAGGATAYNLAKSRAAKKRTTAEGHAKAVAKRNEEYNRMQKTYGNTSYSDRLKQRNKQIVSNRGNRK